MSQTLFINATVLPMNDTLDVLTDSFLAVDGESILEIGSMKDLRQETYQNFDVFDCATRGKNRLILPGFIQTHIHTSQALCRGVADDVDLETWTRKRIWPCESAMTDEDVYISSLLSIAEMIKSGTTFFCEASGQRPDNLAKAILDTGIKGIISLSTMDLKGEIPENQQMTTEEALEKNFGLVERWRGKSSRLDACLNILNLFFSSETLWKEFAAYSRKNNVLVQSHVAESASEHRFVSEKYGLSPVRLLNSWGVLQKNLLTAHMVHLDGEEIDMLAENDVKVMHLPAADLRIAGFAPIQTMLNKGIPVSLGTNSPPCNNRMSIIDEMWLAGLMHKAYNNDPKCVPARSVVQMATRNGAKTLGKEDSVGLLQAGYKADLVILDFNTLCSTPTHEIYSALVYQATGAAVHSVMADGKFLMKDRKLTTIDEDWLIEEAERRAQDIVKCAGVQY